MTLTSEPANRNKCFIGRQPIYDVQMNVVACELLFRQQQQNFASITNGDAATSQVLTTALIEFGLDRLARNHPALINVTHRFLTGEFPLPEVQTQLILEVPEDIEPNDEIIQAIRQQKQRGFRIALDDFVYHPDLQPLVELADIVKVDLQAIFPPDLPGHVTQLRQHPCKLLAEKVETLAEFEYCKQLGFDMFQGFFLSKPRVISQDRLPSNKLAMMELLGKLQDPNVEFSDLEKTISADISFSFKLLKYINSSAFGLRRQVDSLSQAIALLGIQRIRTLVSLIALTGVNDKPSYVITTALTRGKMCENLAKKINRPDFGAFFTVGLFSALDILLDREITTIVDELPLCDEVRAAITDHDGLMGAALDCALAYEFNEFDNISFVKLEDYDIRDCYLQAVDDVEKERGVANQLEFCAGE